MAETAERRSDPTSMWPGAKTAIMLATNYGPSENPLASLENKDRGTISVYARHRDYHDLIKGRLKTLAAKLLSHARKAGHEGDVKVFVDTAPLMEKPLAERAGLGWQGKHTNLVSRTHGSWLFLGCILTDIELPVDDAETDNCGTCRACLDVCPTDAFPAPYRLDARRCISYLTIEHAGPIDRTLRPAMGNRIYGCDDCLAVCPWNKFAEETREIKLRAREDLISPKLDELAELDDENFRALFSGSPIKRIGRDRFIRNVLIAIGNSGDGTLIEPCKKLLEDGAPVVRGAAIWALSQLLGTDAFEALARKHRTMENDPDVISEWNAAGSTG